MPRRVGGPRDTAASAVELDQQHPVTGVQAGVFGRHVGEVAADHRRAYPFDQSPVTTPSRNHQSGFDFAVALFGEPPPVADMQMGTFAVAAGGILTQVQINEMAPAELSDAHPRVR
jgi:FAD/FMN-containing dehydrogenase